MLLIKLLFTSVAAFNDNVKQRTVYNIHATDQAFVTSVAAFNDNVKERTVYMLLIKLFLQVLLQFFSFCKDIR